MRLSFSCPDSIVLADATPPYCRTLLNKRSIFLKYQLDALNDTVFLTGTGKSLLPSNSSFPNQKCTDATSLGRPFDGVISPVNAHCPERHGQEQYLNYTTFINLLDYTSAVFPVTAVVPEIDVKLPAHTFRNKMDKMVYDLCALLSLLDKFGLNPTD